MYYNKKRRNAIALMVVILLLGICGCAADAPKPDESKQEEVPGTVTEAAEITETVDEELAEITDAPEENSVPITQVAPEEETGITGEVKPTEVVEEQPVDAEDVEEEKFTDALKEMEPEELVLHVLTNAEGVYFTSGGVESTELKGYAEEKDVAYFVMKKQNSFGRTHEEVHIGILNPETGELIYHEGYGNTTADAVMVENETGLYILYATECTDFGFYSGYGGALLAKDGTLTQVWPVTPEGMYDDDYWNQHTARLNGETLEVYKVIITEVRPDGIASEMITELERTLTLDEILAGAV